MNLQQHSELEMLEAIAECRELVVASMAAEYNREWAGSIDECGYCGEFISPELEFFADTEIYLDDGIWGILCPLCLTSGRNEMVWGRGQLYQYQADSKVWLMVAGFPPKHLW